MKKIEIDFLPDGTVKIDALGFQGQSCAKATAAFERALGTVSKDTKKPDYYRAEINPQQLKQGQG